MNFFFKNAIHYEPWDWRNPDSIGIGGSEVCQVEMARRMAKRGHEVYSFAPIPGEAHTHEGVRWHPLEDAEKFLDLPGVWVVSRTPEFFDKLPPMPGRKVWLVCQDAEYGPRLTPERLARLDKMLALCPVHADYLAKRCPDDRGKIVLSFNGVRTDLVEYVEAKGPVVRNPLRIVYTSSPDRGLIPLLHIFRRAREFVPGLELSVCYGFDNLDKEKDKHFRKHVAKLKKELEQPGVTFTGRLPQPDLYRLLLSAGMWVYCTNFEETGCISHLEAMACGAVPIFSPLWALEHHGAHGWAIPGDCNDPMTRARFARAVVRLAWEPLTTERIRAEMMPWARATWDWEKVADQYEALAREDSPC